MQQIRYCARLFRRCPIRSGMTKWEMWPGRIWHHRRTLRPAVTGDVRLRVGALRRTPVAGKSGSCPAGEETAGHKTGGKRAPGVKFWVAGHEKGVKRARGGENRGPGHKTGGKRARGWVTAREGPGWVIEGAHVGAGAEARAGAREGAREGACAIICVRTRARGMRARRTGAREYAGGEQCAKKFCEKIWKFDFFSYLCGVLLN